jgi:lipoprotein signal peptidase
MIPVLGGVQVASLGEMSNRISENERRIIYLSVFVIIMLTILFGLHNDQTYSIVAMLLIVIVAIGNIVYIYGRMRRKTEEKKAGTS